LAAGLSRVQALAVRAEFRFHFASFHAFVVCDGVSTAVTAIVLAATVVVFVVAVAISFVIGTFATPCAVGAAAGLTRVQTLAFRAVGCFHFASFHALVVRDRARTAVAAIVLAATVVVFVVAVAIRFELREFATACAFGAA